MVSELGDTSLVERCFAVGEPVIINPDFFDIALTIPIFLLLLFFFTAEFPAFVAAFQASKFHKAIGDVIEFYNSS